MKEKVSYLLSLSVFSTLISCSSNMEKQKEYFSENNFKSSYSYTSMEEDLGEVSSKDERRIIKEVEKSIVRALSKQYQTGLVKRDAHTKHHGCVRATFKVNPNLAPEYKVGVFANNNEYKAWIRFSNGSNDGNKPDIEDDARGMAVKLMGVEGKKLLQAEENEQTQDFIMMNNNRFFIKNLEDYVGFSHAVEKGTLGILGYLITHKESATIVSEIFNKKIDSPLNSDYFSATAYKFGNKPIKFKVSPCAKPNINMPQNPTPNYLKEAMADKLSRSGACFDFMVQKHNGSFEQMPVEDPTVAWDENLSPYVPVAKITIPQQIFDSEEQMTFCENLSFTPWHSLPVHKPLGATNRARKAVYETVSKYRHDRNGVFRREPFSWD